MLMNRNYAYLIIANRNYDQLQKLITLLDDSRNDIYLLIDKKSKNFQHNFKVNYSQLNYVKPINIYWGGYSQVAAEIKLFQAAIPEHYTYYHLLSGLDLPLVNQDVIHNFFDNHLNREFITYSAMSNSKQLSQRIKYHLFRKHFRDNKFVNLYRKFERQFIKLIDEPIPLNKIGYGSNWVSIDDDLANLIVKNKFHIKHIYQYGTLVDELFIPTLLNYHPKLKNRVYYDKPVHDDPNEFQGNLRYINWWDGSPYIWKLQDYNKLIKARKMGHLFSRKFDDKIDNRIVNKIFNDIINE